MVALGALLAVGTTAAATDRAPVAVAARDVPVGTVIEPGDLRLVETSGLAGADFPGTGAEEVVGRRAAVPLKEGTPIPLSALSDAAAWPGPGRAVVAASLPHSAVPEGAGMRAPVAVVLTGAAASAEGLRMPKSPWCRVGCIRWRRRRRVRSRWCTWRCPRRRRRPWRVRPRARRCAWCWSPQARRGETGDRLSVLAGRGAGGDHAGGGAGHVLASFAAVCAGDGGGRRFGRGHAVVASAGR
nr:SAF domain-containing protein [Streptomonospora nanhaiensis]